MNKFEELFSIIEKETRIRQKRLLLNSKLMVYYGLSYNQKFALSFGSSIPPKEMRSTKEISVSIQQEEEHLFWTYFELDDCDSKEVFFYFCESLVSAIDNITDEKIALTKLCDTYNNWKKLFKIKGKMSLEKYMGLFGELFYLKNIAIPKYGLEKAINSWVGPDGFSKDFSIDDTWFEIKTIGTKTKTVKINSISQLESDVDGHLVVLVVEKMSKEYNGDDCNIAKIYDYITKEITDSDLLNIFIGKLFNYGYVHEDLCEIKHRLSVKTISSFIVNETFPKLTSKNIPNVAIENVQYDLSLASIQEFKEDM